MELPLSICVCRHKVSLYACSLSWRVMLGAHLAPPIQAVCLVCAVSVGLRQCALCTVSRSELGAAGTAQTALCAQATPAGSRLRHLDRGHRPWVPISVGAVFSQALQTGLQLMQLGTARSCWTPQGPMGAQVLQQAGCWLRRQQ